MVDSSSKAAARYFAHLRQRNLSPGTIKAYTSILTAYRAWLGGRSLFAATRDDITDWLATRDLDVRARYTYISCLHGFYEWAISEDFTEHDPTVRVPRPKLPRRLPRPMAVSDLEVALEHASPRMRAWLCLDAYQGLRCQEIAGLRVDDLLFGFDPPILVVSAGKGDKERSMALNTETELALREFGIPRSGFVFTRADRPGRGLPMSPRSVSDGIAQFLAGLGITSRAHNGRHLFGTTVYRETKDIRATQELLGHASILTTQLYVQFDPGETSDTVRHLRFSTPRPTEAADIPAASSDA